MSEQLYQFGWCMASPCSDFEVLGTKRLPLSFDADLEIFEHLQPCKHLEERLTMN
jgi:hypothetical protein